MQIVLSMRSSVERPASTEAAGKPSARVIYLPLYYRRIFVSFQTEFFTEHERLKLTLMNSVHRAF